MNTQNKFLEIIRTHINNQSFIRLIISEKRNSNTDLKSITVKAINIRKGLMLSFVYRYPTKDITKNYTFDESIMILKELLLSDFNQALLQTNTFEFHFWTKGNKSGIRQKEISAPIKSDMSHDNVKQRLIAIEHNIYLQELGVLDKEWRIKPSMHDKYRQINKYIEIIEGILKNTLIGDHFSIVDMGSGKGYLTFALYDYLSAKMSVKPFITGVELRKELVESCNKIAEKCQFDQLNFIEGSIKNMKRSNVDMLIALHACDTATDEAIAQGITNKSKIIICAPCCHKQIRAEINPDKPLSNITKFGILKERQSETITDTIRAMILEAYGYKTNVFEFIETEHTPKNVIIVGISTKTSEVPSQEIIEQIQQLKALFGIKNHHLEKLLNL